MPSVLSERIGARYCPWMLRMGGVFDFGRFGQIITCVFDSISPQFTIIYTNHLLCINSICYHVLLHLCKMMMTCWESSFNDYALLSLVNVMNLCYAAITTRVIYLPPYILWSLFYHASEPNWQVSLWNHRTWLSKFDTKREFLTLFFELQLHLRLHWKSYWRAERKIAGCRGLVSTMDLARIDFVFVSLWTKNFIVSMNATNCDLNLNRFTV